MEMDLLFGGSSDLRSLQSTHKPNLHVLKFDLMFFDSKYLTWTVFRQMINMSK